MKKFVTISLILLLLVLSVCFVACNSTSFSVVYLCDDGGRILGQTPQTVKSGNDAKVVTAMPNDGYRFNGWSDGETDQTRNDKKITQNLTVKAFFVKEDRMYQLNYSATKGGKIEGETSQIVLRNQNGETVTAIAEEFYTFVEWSDGKTDAVRTDYGVIADINAVAKFALKETFKLTYTATAGGKIVGTAEQVVEGGFDGEEVSAVADSGYSFVMWSDGYRHFSRTDIDVVENLDIEAIFVKTYKGEGTEQSPFLIYNQTEFSNIVYYAGANFKLMANLNFSGIDHKPLFDVNQLGFYNTFNGVFDGNDYIISNLKVDCESKLPSLFGAVSNVGIIKNLKLNNFYINIAEQTDSTDVYVGAIAGINYGVMENIFVSGNITAKNFKNSQIAIGGVCGKSAGLLKDVTSQVNISLKNVDSAKEAELDKFNVGVLCGILSNNAENIKTSGKIEIQFANSQSVANVGGAVGLVSSELEQLEINKVDSNVEFVQLSGKCNSGGVIGKVYLPESKFIASNLKSNSKNFNSGAIDFAIVLGGEIANSTSVGITVVAGFLGEVVSEENLIIESNSAFSNSLGEFGFAKLLENVVVYRCFANGYSTVSAFLGTVNNSKVEQCYADGKVQSTTNSASSFIMEAVVSEVINCYSICDLSIVYGGTKEIVAGGMFASIDNSNVKNCYFGGEIYVESNKSASVGAFYGKSFGNVHLEYFYTLQSFSGDVSYKLLGSSNLSGTLTLKDVDEFATIEKMLKPNDLTLARILNNNLSTTLWVFNSKTLPTFSWQN